VLRTRLGLASRQIEGIEYGDVRTINGVRFSFHPAGHVPGSSQILVERGGERWVFIGDYKLENDGVSQPFEPVRCNVFISECTFGLPVFNWQPQAAVFADMTQWVEANRVDGVSSVICAYSLGKAQRVLSHLGSLGSKVFVHAAVWSMCEALGMISPAMEKVGPDTKVEGACVVAPPAVSGTSWLKRFGRHQVSSVSGWMAIRGIKRRRGIEKGFVLSDHADFKGLTTAVKATGAERIMLTHGYTAVFARWLDSLGLDASELRSQYGDDNEEQQ
jgi:putative mRNA 3-end processing factor